MLDYGTEKSRVEEERGKRIKNNTKRQLEAPSTATR
jgi:hypothetical protein